METLVRHLVPRSIELTVKMIRWHLPIKTPSPPSKIWPTRLCHKYNPTHEDMYSSAIRQYDRQFSPRLVSNNLEFSAHTAEPADESCGPGLVKRKTIAPAVIPSAHFRRRVKCEHVFPSIVVAPCGIIILRKWTPLSRICNQLMDKLELDDKYLYLIHIQLLVASLCWYIICDPSKQLNLSSWRASARPWDSFQPDVVPCRRFLPYKPFKQSFGSASSSFSSSGILWPWFAFSIDHKPVQVSTR